MASKRASKKRKQRLFSGMGYRDVQQSNANRRSQLPKRDRTWLKQNGYKNVGWENVIRLYQKINELVCQPDEDEDTLEELFLKADRVGNKYQTPQEIRDYNQKLSVAVNDVADEIDRQFPETEIEFVDYGQTTSRAANKRKRR